MNLVEDQPSLRFYEFKHLNIVPILLAKPIDSPVDVLNLYLDDSTGLEALLSETPNIEAIFTLNALIVMQGRAAVNQLNNDDNSLIRKTIPFIHGLNKIWATNQAIMTVKLHVNPDQHLKLLHAILNLKIGSDDRKSGLLEIRQIFGISTPPTPEQRPNLELLNQLVLTIGRLTAQVATLDTNLANSIDPTKYNLPPSSNEINVVDTKYSITAGDRHYLNSGRGPAKNTLELLNTFLLPEMDAAGNALFNQPDLISLETATDLIEWIKTLRYDERVFESEDADLVYKLTRLNRIHDHFKRKITNGEYSPIQMQAEWLEYMNDHSAMDVRTLTTQLQNIAIPISADAIPLLDPAISNPDIYQLLKDFLVTRDEMKEIIQLLNQKRLNNQKPVTLEMISTTIAKIATSDSAKI